MVDGEAGAEFVVVHHDVDAVHVAFADDHDRDARRGLLQRFGDDAEQHQAVHPHLQERLDGLRLEQRVPAAAADEHPQARAVQALLQPVEELGEERVVQVGDDGADQPGAALDQAPRDGVRPVAELAGGLQDGLPPAFAHVRRPRITSETSDLETPARSATLRIVGFGAGTGSPSPRPAGEDPLRGRGTASSPCLSYGFGSSADMALRPGDLQDLPRRRAAGEADAPSSAREEMP